MKLNGISREATAIYCEKLQLILEKLQESVHHKINIGCLNVTIECKTLSENICDPL